MLADRLDPRRAGRLGRRLTVAGLLGAALVVTGALPVVAAVATSGPTWSWPLQPRPRVLSGFDAPTTYGPGSRGVDLAAIVGQPVLAAAAGTVGFAGLVAGVGVVSVDHAGVVTTYEPVTADVRIGQVVPLGSRLGTVDALPRLCGVSTCLHWGAYVPGSVPRTYLDPLALVGGGPVRLLPMGPVAEPGVAVGRLSRPLAGAPSAVPRGSRDADTSRVAAPGAQPPRPGYTPANRGATIAPTPPTHATAPTHTGPESIGASAGVAAGGRHRTLDRIAAMATAATLLSGAGLLAPVIGSGSVAARRRRPRPRR